MISGASVTRGESRLIHGVRSISTFMLVLGGLLILVAAGLIVVEVVARQVFRRSLGGVDELAGYALAVSSAWSFAATLLDKRHIRIDTIYQHMRPPVRAVFDVLGLAALIGFLLILTPHAYEVFSYSLAYGTTSQTPLATPRAIPQGLWVGGLVWFTFVASVLFMVSVRALLLRRFDRVHELAGTPSIEAELTAEVAARQSR